MKRIIKIIWVSSIIICLTAGTIDILFNCLNGWLLILCFLPLFVLPFYKGLKVFSAELFFILISTAIWIYSEFLIEQINGAEISLFASLKGRLLVAFIGFIGIGIVGKILIRNSLSRFANNVKNIFLIPKIFKAFTYLTFSYIAITFLFSLVYASAYVYSDGIMFMEENPRFMDFILYSFYVPTTFSYAGLTPKHWLISTVTLLELFIGLFITIVYIGVIVGLITERINKKPDIFS